MADAVSFSARRPWYSPVRLAQRLVIYVVVAYLTLCAFLYLEQNNLEYPRVAAGVQFAPEVAIEKARANGMMPWDSHAANGPALLGYVPSNFKDAAARGTIVMFHGNGGWAGEQTPYASAFSRRGFRSFFYEYPGYGGRPGSPSEKSIVPEAQTLIRALEREGFGPLYIWGESLGSGVASAVCADATLPVHGLVLMMPWDTVASVGHYRYPFIPVSWLMSDRYDSITNLAHFRHPICVVRGTNDPIVPAALTIHLFDHLPGRKKMIVQTGYGHGDWPNGPGLDWWDEALNFIAGN